MLISLNYKILTNTLLKSTFDPTTVAERAVSRSSSRSSSWSRSVSSTQSPSSHTPIMASEIDVKLAWIDYLEIPRNLTVHSNTAIPEPNALADSPAPSPLQQLWAKYVACLDAQQRITTMTWSPPAWSPTWRQPNQSDIIALFISTSQWHNTWKRPLKDVVTRFPDMQDWLAQSPNAKSALEVWGYPPIGEGTYRFKDLEMFVKGKYTGRSSTSPSKSKRQHRKKSSLSTDNKDIDTTSNSDSAKAGPSKIHR